MNVRILLFDPNPPYRVYYEKDLVQTDKGWEPKPFTRSLAKFFSYEQATKWCIVFDHKVIH
jgi:hypothetical protein